MARQGSEHAQPPLQAGSPQDAFDQTISGSTARAEASIHSDQRGLERGETLLASAANAASPGPMKPSAIELGETLAGSQSGARSSLENQRSNAALNGTEAADSAEDQAFANTLDGSPERAPTLGSSIEPPSEHYRSAKGEFPVMHWDRYEFIKLLGQGGMGAVYKARDRRLERIVALKFIRGGNEQMTQRFMQEARAQSRVDHPGICKVYEVGEVDGKAYIAMQFIDGKSLETAGQTMSMTQKILVIRSVAEAIHEAHRLGIIHRDLKPANIMVEYGIDGRLHPIVMDFGLARQSDEGHHLTETGAVMGTPAYMAPEQARGETRAIDRRADVYSLGATLYDLIVGVPPFNAESVVNILLQVVNEEAKPLRTHVPSVPVELETIVMKCLNKEPSKRYDSAKALAEDLERYMNGEPIRGRRTSFVYRVKRWAQKNRTLFTVSALSAVVVLAMGISALRQYLSHKRERERIAVQARIEQELAQQLGQEITKMEWELRSARQLPLHDLRREKSIIRQQMATLHSGLRSYGELSRGLAHYALGRGHMALHEYPQALTALQLAIRAGKSTPDVHYTIGVVLGKHFEQVMYEARMSGGGDWAKKQLKEIEPKYLTPAIDSLKRSRAMKSDSMRYLDALIAYYQRDYVAALNHAAVALRETPWLYEAHKLAGDIHLERALQARDGGHYEEAEKEFGAAVQKYEEAADAGRSDAEVYEGLAEAWVRQIEMALTRGRPTEAAFIAAVVASDKIMTAEPESIAGPLKKAFASMMTMAASGAGLSSAERVKQCLKMTDAVLAKQPEHPYAREAAANCNLFAAEGARTQGQDPEPLVRKSIRLLEPTVQRYPHFLWGLNDLGNAAQYLGIHLQLHGKPGAKEELEKSLSHFAAALALDPTYLVALVNGLSSTIWLVPEARSAEAVQSILARADDWVGKCTTINNQFQQCFNNYFQIYVRAAARALLTGQDPQPRLKRALQNLAHTRRLGGSLLDAEQHAAMAHVIEATDLARRKLDPSSALSELKNDLVRCFAVAAQDAMCRTLAAQGSWAAAEWAAAQHRPPLPLLKDALAKALLATQSPETYPDAWQTLAETHLRLSRSKLAQATVRNRYIAEGLAATERIFALNPNHAQGRATQGALELLRAQTLHDKESRRGAARASREAFEKALKLDSCLSTDYAPFLAQAKKLSDDP